MSLVLQTLFLSRSANSRYVHSFPTRRSSDLIYSNSYPANFSSTLFKTSTSYPAGSPFSSVHAMGFPDCARSEEHTSELQSRGHLVCRLLLEKKIKGTNGVYTAYLSIHHPLET